MNPLDTKIYAVTVYPDRARVRREGKIGLEAGLQQLEIGELPLQMAKESLRVSARGSVGSRLLGAQVQRRFYTETPSEAIRALEEQIEALQEEIKKLDIQVELIKQQRSTLDKIAGHSDKFALALAAGEMKVEDELAIFEALRVQAQKLEGEALGLQSSRKQIDHKVQKLTKELEQLRGSRPRERYAAVVEVEMQQEGELTVELSYMVSNAEWKPIYDLRLLEEGNGSICEVSYMAQVAQMTGESWDGVQLTLATARPSLSRSLPELQPWYVRPPSPPVPMPRAVVQSAPATAPMAARAKAAPQVETFGAAPAPAEMEAEVVVAEEEASGTAVTYAIPGVVSVPPDGAAHNVTMAQFRLIPQLDYVSAPRLVEAAYRRARLKNDSPHTLLAGETSLFVGEEFIGSSPLELTAPQGEIELSLGVEDRIKVERELKRRDTDKRLIGGRRHLVYGYEIRVENLLPIKAELKLHDQIPVARHEEIKVKLEACEPKPGEQTELNLIKWELSLEPKEKRNVRFDFSVDSPQGMEVVGLP
jgi:uncharacterized protein (TIGR02231 family)